MILTCGQRRKINLNPHTKDTLEKHHRLSYYYEHKNHVDRSSQSLSVFNVCDDISSLFSSNEYPRDSRDEDDIINLISKDKDNTITSSATPTQQPSMYIPVNKANDFPSLDSINAQPTEQKYRRSSVAPERVCPKCNQRKLNDECSLHVCKTCCVASTEKCSLPDHKRSKVGARKPYDQTTTTTATTSQPLAPNDPSAVVDTSILEKINSAIAAKCAVWISYLGSPPREIIPRGFKEGKEGRLVNATCSIIEYTTNKKQDQSRSFYLHKITRIEDHNWVNPPATTQEQGPALTSVNVPTIPSPVSLCEFLHQLKVEHYLDAFNEAGFDDLDTLRNLTEKALNDMGVKTGHQGKILRRAKEINL